MCQMVSDSNEPEGKILYEYPDGAAGLILTDCRLVPFSKAKRQHVCIKYVQL